MPVNPSAAPKAALKPKAAAPGAGAKNAGAAAPKRAPARKTGITPSVVLDYALAVMSIMYLVFYFIDRVNTAMEFINNDMTKWLMLANALCALAAVALCMLRPMKAKSYPALALCGLISVSLSIGYIIIFIADISQRDSELFDRNALKLLLALWSAITLVFAEWHMYASRKLRLLKRVKKTAARKHA